MDKNFLLSVSEVDMDGVGYLGLVRVVFSLILNHKGTTKPRKAHKHIKLTSLIAIAQPGA